MYIKCPNCGYNLTALGYVYPNGDWVFENMYKCINCKPGYNRFDQDLNPTQDSLELRKDSR